METDFANMHHLVRYPFTPKAKNYLYRSILKAEKLRDLSNSQEEQTGLTDVTVEMESPQVINIKIGEDTPNLISKKLLATTNKIVHLIKEEFLPVLQTLNTSHGVNELII